MNKVSPEEGNWSKAYDDLFEVSDRFAELYEGLDKYTLRNMMTRALTTAALTMSEGYLETPQKISTIKSMSYNDAGNLVLEMEEV